METFQLENIPTLLAYPLLRYQHGTIWEPQRLFLLLELLLLYSDNLLRAQLQDLSGLQKPVGLGQRVERCLLSLRALEKQSRVPLVDILREDKRNEQLGVLIAARNKWAHSGANLNTQRRVLDQTLDELLSRMKNVSIVLSSRRSDGERALTELSGVNGLFAGKAFNSPVLSLQTEDLLEPRLFAVPLNGDPVNLFPFFIYRQGVVGEHRVELLNNLHGGKQEYFDPFDATA